MSLKPIETRYKGYRFRSRLEARWAVFFDALQIVWEYETEGFVTQSGEYYLPDFTIHNVPGLYRVEIKPYLPNANIVNEILDARCTLLVGNPWRDGNDYPYVFHYYLISRYWEWEEGHDGEYYEVFAGCRCGNPDCNNVWLDSLDGNTGYYLNLQGEPSKLVSYYRRDCYHCPHSGTDGGQDDRCYETQRSERLQKAYVSARSARFEYGETPQ